MRFSSLNNIILNIQYQFRKINIDIEGYYVLFHYFFCFFLLCQLFLCSLYPLPPLTSLHLFFLLFAPFPGKSFMQIFIVISGFFLIFSLFPFIHSHIFVEFIGLLLAEKKNKYIDIFIACLISYQRYLLQVYRTKRKKGVQIERNQILIYNSHCLKWKSIYSNLHIEKHNVLLIEADDDDDGKWNRK